MSNNTSRILIQNINLDMFIGVNDFEKQSKQPVNVSLTLDVKSNSNWQDDDINDVLNYDEIIQAIRLLAADENKHIELIETFAEKIALLCLDKDLVQSVTVKVGKPAIYDYVEEVAVELARSK